MKKIVIYDTTLRDGAQSKGISFSTSDKIAIIKALERLGVDYIEGGNPSAGVNEKEIFSAVKKLKLKHAQITAFGMTRRKGETAALDKGLAELLEAGTDIVTIYGKASLLHAEKIVGVSAEENLDIIYDSVKYLRTQGRAVIFDAEHFFDGYHENPEYALRVLEAAYSAGAECLVLCDTNGGRLPEAIAKATEKAVSLYGRKIGIHCHNDSDTAVASSISAVLSGAEHVQGTLLGFGERCGNASLASVIPDLQLKLGYDCIENSRLKKLTRISREVAGISNYRIRSFAPYIGADAFSHKAGAHIDGVLKDTESFEHVQPETVGNERTVLLSGISGRSALAYMLSEHFPHITRDSKDNAAILSLLKELEGEGYFFEDALSSFELVVHRYLGSFKPHFELLRYTSNEEFTNDHQISSALVKVSVNGKTHITAAEGSGPVHALDFALREALKPFYPSLACMRLEDYKVRVLDPNMGTAARVRVVIESADDRNSWTTVGVSTDIIAASLKAIIDSIEYKLMKDQEGAINE